MALPQSGALGCPGGGARGAIGLGSKEFVPPLLREVVDGIPVESGEPEGAEDISGRVATAAVGALGGAEVAIAFAASWAVYQVAA